MTVAWISEYPVEWRTDLPASLRELPRQHPATWMSVLLGEFAGRSDLKLHVITLRKNVPEDVTFERNGVCFHILRTRGGLRAPSLFWHDTMLIGRRLRQVNPDLIHAWGTERGAAMVAVRLGRPNVVTMQGLLSWYEQLIPFPAHDRLAAWIERLSLRRARVVTTESAFAAEYLRTRYPHLVVKQVEHAPNEIFHTARRRPQIQPPRLIAVGAFGYRKGSDLLLRALGRLTQEQPFELLVVGATDAKMVEALKPELPAGLWQRIHFKDGLRPEEVAAELEQATIAVLPTRADTSPNAVKEAVVAGVPVVATRVGGIPDYVFEGENGLLCASGSVEGLAEALRGALRHPLFGQGRVTEATLARVRAYLSPERMAANFFEAYQAALGQTPAQ